MLKFVVKGLFHMKVCLAHGVLHPILRHIKGPDFIPGQPRQRINILEFHNHQTTNHTNFLLCTATPYQENLSSPHQDITKTVVQVFFICFTSMSQVNDLIYHLKKD